MAVLYQIPIFHTRKDITAGIPTKLLATALVGKNMSLVDLLDEYTVQYWRELIPSFLGQLHSAGLLDRKKRFTRPAHVFLDGVWWPGLEFLKKILETRVYRESPMYELTTRLCAAGAQMQKTELFCLLGKVPKSNEHVEQISALRDIYITGRIRRVLSKDPDAVAFLIIGAGHKRIELPSPIEVKIFHRGEIWPRRFLREFLDKDMRLPLCQPDDFGHAAGYEEPAIVNV